MSLMHGNIKMLRALGRAIGEGASMRLGAGGDSPATLEDRVARLVMCDLATACHDAAQDLERQEQALLDRVIEAGREQAQRDGHA